MKNFLISVVGLVLSLILAFGLMTFITWVVGFWFDYPLTFINIAQVWVTVFVYRLVLLVFEKIGE